MYSNKFINFFILIFSKKEKISAFKLLILLIIAAALEILTLGSIQPIFTLFSKSEEGLLAPLLLYFSQSEIVYIVSFGILALFAFKTLFLWQLIRFQTFFAYNFMARISSEIFRSYSVSSLLIDPGRNNSEIIRNIMREPNLLVGGVVLPILTIATEASIMIAIFIVLLWYSPIITIIVVLFLGIATGFYIYYFGSRLKKLGGLVQLGEAFRYREVENLTSGSKDLYIVNMGKIYSKKFDLHTLKNSINTSYMQIYKQSNKIFIEFIAITLIVILVVCLFYFGYTQSQIISMVTLYLIALFRILPSANRLVINVNTISFNTASLLVVSNLIISRAKLRFESLANNKDFDLINWEKFSVNDISFNYPDSNVSALSNLNFEVLKGEKIAILGSSGSGKTTLVDILIGLKKHNCGDFKFKYDGVEKLVQGLPQKLIGYVPQNIYLFEGSIEENITLEDFHNAEVDDSRLQSAIKLSGLIDFIKIQPNGLKSNVGQNGSALSGGQLQRIGLARALYRKPDILILDEATSGLDSITEMNIFDKLLKVNDLTVLCITHNKDLASIFPKRIQLP
jgi:ATP-binding cassette subfamily C protein